MKKLTDNQKGLLGIAGTGLVSGIGLGNSLAQIKDTSGEESSIEDVGSTQFGSGNYNTLLSSFDSNNMARTNYTADELRGFTPGQLAGNILAATTAGALSGVSKGGGVGALLEGGANFLDGTLGALIGNSKAHAKAVELNKLAEEANKQYLNNFNIAVSNTKDKMFNNSLLNLAAYGGPLFNHSGGWSNGITFINEGGTHESNPLGGVPVGVDQEGTPNLVEEGEVIYKDYVFSNRLKPTKKQIEKAGLKSKYEGKTFAEIITDIQQESSENLDFISQNTLEDMIQIVTSMQEEVRAKKQKPNNNTFDDGGWKKRLNILSPVINAFNLQTLDESENDIQAALDAETAMLENQTSSDLESIVSKANQRRNKLMQSADTKYGDGFFNWTQGLNSTTPLSTSLEGLNDIESNKSKSKTFRDFNLEQSLRYAPVVTDTASLLHNIFKTPDYTNAEAGLKAMQKVPVASTSPIGGKQKYVPIDRNYLLNQHLNKSAGNRRAYQNMGVNAAQTAGLLMAENLNNQTGVGESLIQMDRENLARQLQTAQFNTAIDQYNTNQAMQALGLNMQRGYNIAQAAANAGQLREAIDASRAQSISSSLSGLSESLSGIGTEAIYSDWLKGLTDTGALQDLFKYRKANTGKCGGRLMTKKR